MILDGTAGPAISSCATALKAGELVAFPTETVYGLGADAGNDAAVAKIFAAKGRPSNHPLIVHVDHQQQGTAGVAYFAAAVPPFAQQLMDCFWPGPLTLILRRRPGAATAAAGAQYSIALRCPAHPVAQALLSACRRLGVMGLAGPSANQFGRVSPTTAAHVEGEFGAQLLILDGGACSVGIESTIIDCTRGTPILLRPGAITPAQVHAACGQPVFSVDEAAGMQARAPSAPGTLVAHYAPKARVRMMDARALQTALDLLGSDLKHGAHPVIATYARAILHSPSPGVLRRRMPDDASATAQQLFAVLREFDASGVKLIWVETPPATPQWDGVRDRLQRASAAG